MISPISQANVSIYTFHGSPGTSDDFSLITPLITKVSWLPFPFDHGHESSLSPLSTNPFIFVAYSFGAFKALLETTLLLQTSKKNIPKAIILISPYFTTKSPSAVGETILRSFAGSLLLSLIGKSSIKKFMSKSASPAPVPESYLKQLPILSDTKLLRESLLEKKTNLKFEDISKQVLENKIPLFLIHGLCDKTSPTEKIADLHLPWIEQYSIENGGHALPWTHPEEVAVKLTSWLKDLSLIP